MRFGTPQAIVAASLILSLTARFLWRYEGISVTVGLAYRLNRLTGTIAICKMDYGASRFRCE